VTAIGANASGYTVTDDASHASVTLSWAAATDVGHHRADNEDSFVVACPVFAVADGMGGHSCGDVASDAVVRGLATLQTAGFTTTEAIDGALVSAVKGLSDVLDEDQRGAGTTVTGAALVTTEDAVRWAVFNIGDSRVYAFFNGALQQVTVDHSVVQQLVDAGQITREEADYHPHSNVITRAVGVVEEPVPDYFFFNVEAGMRLLLCSDGLTKELTDAGIAHFLESAATPQDAVDELVKAALGNSGRDNVTVVVIDVHGVNPPLIHG
jgi:serine/threonine protein phosphatase PrpC